jgi:NitT/TauT family transport system substrate-binding protein
VYRAPILRIRVAGLALLLLTLFWLNPAGAEIPRIVVAIPGPLVAPFLPLELLARNGLDRKHGFALTLRHFPGGPLALKDMVEGDSDFAGLGMPALAGMRLANPDLVSIAVLTDLPAYALLVRQDLKPRIRKIADLRGLRIGTHSGSKQGKSTARQLAEFLLLRQGVALDDVNFVHAGQNLADYRAALRSGQVDAIVVNEPAASMLVNQKLAWCLVDLHDPHDAKVHLGGRFLYTQVAASRAALASQPEKARLLVSALRDTLRWMARHSARDIVGQLNLPEGEEKQVLQAFLAEHKGIYSTNAAFGAEAVANSQAFFRAVNGDDPAALQLNYLDFIDSRWSGRGR